VSWTMTRREPRADRGRRPDHAGRVRSTAGVADFRAHLDGRVHWVEQVNPQRGAKLRRVFERIVW
jgi:RNA-directed DNA polymerase